MFEIVIMPIMLIITMKMTINSKVRLNLFMYGASGWPVFHCASLIGKYHDDDNFDNDDVHADACDDNYADGDE